MSYETPFIDKWPKISFDELENLEVEGSTTRLMYRSFFKVLRLPETIVRAFLTVLL